MSEERTGMRRILAAVIAVACAASLTIVAIGAASPSTPDPAFNGTGFRLDNLEGDSAGKDAGFVALAVLPDDRVVAVGHQLRADGSLQSLVARFRADGTPDPTFAGGAGIAAFPFDPGSPPQTSQLNAIAVAPDGGIVVAGTQYNATDVRQDILVARLHPDGTVDTAFGGGDGVFTYSRADSFTSVTDLTLAGVSVQSDGKILVGGYTSTTNANQALVVRIEADGSGLDTGYATSGADVETINDQGTKLISGASMAVAPDGKLHLAVDAYYQSVDNVDTLVWDASGHPDATGRTGCATLTAPVGGCRHVVPNGGSSIGATSLAIAADGSSYIAAQDNGGQGRLGVVIKENPDGTDGSFPDAPDPAVVALPFTPYGLTLLPGDRLAVAGRKVNPGDDELAVEELTTAGALDVGFNPSAAGDERARIFAAPTAGEWFGWSVAPASDGRLVLVGSVGTATNGKALTLRFGDPGIAADDAAGNAVVGHKVTPDVILRPKNGMPVKITGLSVSPGDWSTTDPNGCNGRTLQPNTACVVPVTFAPTATGTRDATLTVSRASSALTVNLHGTGIAPTTTTTTQTTPPTTTVAQPSGGKITGPTKLDYGRSGLFVANFAGQVTDYAWDLDGSGAFATHTGARPSLSFIAKPAGTVVIKVRATGPGGTSEASTSVRITRPSLAGIEYSPALPAPGEPVKLKFVTSTDEPEKQLLYSWHLEGEKPATRSGFLGRRGKTRSLRAAAPGAGVPPEIQLKGNAEPTDKPTLTRSFQTPGVHRVQMTTVDADGTVNTAITDINVVTATNELGGLFHKIPVDPNTPKKCGFTNQQLMCAGIDIGGNPDTLRQGEDVAFHDITPGYEWCINTFAPQGSNERKIVAKAYQAALDLGRPGDPAQPAAQVDNTILGGVHSGPAAQAHAANTQIVQKNECREIQPQTVHWQFDDENPNFSLDGNEPSDRMKTFTTSGPHEVTLYSRIYYLDASMSQGPNHGVDINLMKWFSKSQDELLAAGLLKSYVVKTTVPLTVYQKICQPIELGAHIKVWAFQPFGWVGSDEANNYDPHGKPIGCFVVDDFTYKGSTLLRPEGMLSLDGIGIQGPAIVDPDAESIFVTWDGDPLSLTFYDHPDGESPADYGTGARFSLGTTSRIDLKGLHAKPVELQPQIRSRDADNNQVVTPAVVRSVFALPAFWKPKPPGLAGFNPTGVRAYLSTTDSASAVVSLKSKPPITGATPTVWLGGHHGATLRSYGQKPDWVFALPSFQLGGFEAHDFKLQHFREAPADPQFKGNTGYSEGGGVVKVDIGLFSGELASPPLAPEPLAPSCGTQTLGDPAVEDYAFAFCQSTSGGGVPDCEDIGKTVGPSGLAFGDQTGFLWAGWRLTLGTDIPVGPIGLRCFAGGAVNSDKAFVAYGLVKARFPANTDLLTADGCSFFAMLDKGGTTNLCGAPGGLYAYKAPAAEMWQRTAATLYLFDDWPLGGGSVDLHVGGGGFESDFEGHLGRDVDAGWHLGPFGVRGGVSGYIVATDKKKGFYAKAHLQLYAGACPLCIKAKAVVSSKGIGGCASIWFIGGGFVIQASDPVPPDIFFGCDWSDFDSIKVRSTLGAVTDLRLKPDERAALGARSSVDFAVPNNSNRGASSDKVQFAVTGVDAAPRVKVTGPGIAETVGPTESVEARAEQVLRGTLPKPDASKPLPRVEFMVSDSLKKTFVVVHQPKAGKYTVTIQDGSAPITGGDMREAVLQRQVNATVVKGASGRRLNYRITPARGQLVEFYEEGPGVSRPIGEVKTGGRGSLAIPDDPARGGRRTIHAVIIQADAKGEMAAPASQGDMVVADYVAPPPPKVHAPVKVVVDRSGRGGTIKACWSSVADADSYVVTADVADGRQLRQVVEKGRCASFPGIDGGSATNVSVSAVTPWATGPAGRDGATAVVRKVGPIVL